MKSLQQVFVNVSGIDPNDGASVVFVWCRDKGPADMRLLGSGHVVDVPAHARPPGIQAGQFSVTLMLPPGCSADDLFVTDDKSGSKSLTGVTVVGGLGQSQSSRDDGVAASEGSLAVQRMSPALHGVATSNGRG